MSNNTKKDDIQWHPVFLSSIKEAFKKDIDKITIEDEVSLSSKPLKVDILIIKLEKNHKMSNPIAKIFSTYNLIEFKSPSDRLESTDFDKGIIYAKLHQVLKNPKEETTNNYTITLMASTYPKAMFERVEKRGYKIVKDYPIEGMFQIECEYKMQVVVFNMLDDISVLYPFAPYISMVEKGKKGAFKSLFEKLEKDNSRELKHLLGFSIKNGLIGKEEEKEVLEMITKLTPQRKKEYYTYLKDTWLVKEGIEEGKKEGIKEGVKKGIKEGIKDIIDIKFGEAGYWILEKIKKINEIEILEEIKNKIKSAKSIEDIKF